MNGDGKKLRIIFAGVMLLFSLALAGWTVLRAGMDFQIEDLESSLDTSRGRERKQQYEYDQVVEELPLRKAELAEAEPKAEAAKEEMERLKEERKRLRKAQKEREEKAGQEDLAQPEESTGGEQP